MKNAVFWDIYTRFIPHRKHIISPLQSPTGYWYVRFQMFTAVTMKNAEFWDVTLCGFCKNRHFEGSYYDIVFLRSVRQLLVIAKVVPSSPIIITLMM
jgi:hypothetical protein